MYKIENIEIINKLELVKVLRKNLGYTIDNCLKIINQLTHNDFPGTTILNIEIIDEIFYALSNAKNLGFISFKIFEDKIDYRPRVYVDENNLIQSSIGFTDAEKWYNKLDSEQQKYVRDLSSTFSPMPFA